MNLSDMKLTTPYLELDPLFYQEVEPTPLKNPFLISTSKEAGKLLGLREDFHLDEKLVEILNGSHLLEGSNPFAMCYAGHQFGNFVYRLGDGRAINLGKVNNHNLQLKGSGLTLYSRMGDGRAVLRSSVREYLASEAMHGLGIKTTRALALVGSETMIAREQKESAAIVLRLSRTWIRFGTFEYFKAKRKPEMVKKLADYVIEESFPHLKSVAGSYLKMYVEIVKNTAKTIASWQSVGFNHGVMNTDNMSIDGRTIDYGPFAFLDDYDSNYICNHNDVDGRYSFKNQPGIAHWNLQQLANALSAIINYEEALEVLDENFGKTYEDTYLKLMFKKMGLACGNFDLACGNLEDIKFLKWMLGALESSTIDYTKFFRLLSRYDGDKTAILDIAVFREPLREWLEAYDERLKKESLSQKKRHAMMLSINPKYVLKNFLLQEAIEKAKNNDFAMVEDMLQVAHNPFDEHEELEYLYKSAPLESKNLKLSCSS